MSLRTRLGDERGASLVLALALLSLLGVLATSVLGFADAGTRAGVVARERLARQYAADAGMEYGIRALAADPSACRAGGGTRTWPPIVVNGHTVTYRCEWLANAPRTVRLVARADAADGGGPTTISATVLPDSGPVVRGWRVRGEWSSPGASTTTTTTTAPAPTTTTTTTPPPLTGSLFLKTSGPGNRTSSTPLPLSGAAPTATVLPNYDTDRDSAPGLVIRRGAGAVDEANTTRFQEWAMPVTAPTVIDSGVSVVLWSSMKGYTTGKRGVVTAYLRDCALDGTSCQNLGSTVDRRSWNGTTAGWVSTTFTFGAVSHTVEPGRSLRLKVVVGTRSADDMWFAFDTTSLPSRIDFGS